MGGKINNYYMYLIIGLGNPGLKYNNTRHNIGFSAVNHLHKNWGVIYNFSDWRLSQKFSSELAEGQISGKKIILAKPITYMNGSGTAVKKLFDFYKIPRRDIIVIHDDFDLPLDAIRESYGRGSAGHKGVESIIAALGTKNFTRIRIGIRPSDKILPLKSLDKWVLKKFTAKEQKKINEVIKMTINKIENIICINIK